MTPTSGGGHHHHPPEELINEGVAHETSDVNVRAILGFAGIIVVVTVVCAVIVWIFFDVLESQAAARDPKMSPLARPATQMPNTTTASPYFGGASRPQLVTNEPAVPKSLRQTEDKSLSEYGWVDEKGGVTRVPIDQAKKRLVERGLPSRPSPADPALGTHAPAFGESTSGRSIPTGERSAAPKEQEKTEHPPSGRGGGA
jgi:hypothetical protein